ncbi:MAG: hypothetical protein ACRC68_03450 [Clostridium sp.]
MINLCDLINLKLKIIEKYLQIKLERAMLKFYFQRSFFVMMKTVEEKVVSESNKFNKNRYVEVAKLEAEKVALEKNKEEFKVLA